MRRELRPAAALLAALIGAPPAIASEFWTRSLAGLDAVRVTVTTVGAADPVEAEMVAAAPLVRAGLVVSPSAPTVLAASVTMSEGAVAVDLSLIQSICLERDPLACTKVPTWFRGTAERVEKGHRPEDAALSLLSLLAEQFAVEWRRENSQR